MYDPISPAMAQYGSDEPIQLASDKQQREPRIGDIVHFILPNGLNEGAHRPGIIVRIWSPHIVQLVVFTDGPNDFTGNHPGTTGVMWASSVPYSSNFGARTWHWPDHEL